MQKETNMVGDGVKALVALGADAVQQVRGIEALIRASQKPYLLPRPFVPYATKVDVKIHLTRWSIQTETFYIRACGRTLLVSREPIIEPMNCAVKVQGNSMNPQISL